MASREKSSRTRRQSRHWSLLLINGHGETITIGHIKGLIITLVAAAFLMLVVASVLFYSNRRFVIENDGLQNSLTEMKSRLISLRNDRDLCMARLVAAEPGIERLSKDKREKLEIISDKKEIDEIVTQLKNLDDKDAIASLDHLAKVAHGAELIGSLKMDADNMGLILKEGLPTDFYLEHLIGFSRYISYFFKIYLNSICNDKKSFGKQTSFLDGRSDSNKRNLAVVYSGGDDSFILGAWDEVARVAIDISAAFKEYTCHNPDLGISAGVTLHDPKMPVYQIVQTTDKALKIAKDNQQECWQCHENWLNCPLLSKVKCKRKDSLCLFYTPYLYGRWLELKERPLPKYEKKFNRLNLVAKWQFYHDGQSINEVEDYILSPLRQILSAFSRLKKGGRMVHRLLDILDVWQEEGEIYLPKLVWLMARFKTELERIKTEDKFSLYEVLDRQLHYYNPNKLSILHVPLMWTALWLRGGENE